MSPAGSVPGSRGSAAACAVAPAPGAAALALPASPPAPTVGVTLPSPVCALLLTMLGEMLGAMVGDTVMLGPETFWLSATLTLGRDADCRREGGERWAGAGRWAGARAQGGSQHSSSVGACACRSARAQAEQTAAALLLSSGNLQVDGRRLLAARRPQCKQALLPLTARRIALV